MKKILLFLLGFALFSLLFPLQIHADSDFSTDYLVTYTINNDASTHVNIAGSLTNLTTNYYASSYTVNLGFQDVSDIAVSDANGPISPKITKNNGGTDVEIDFNNRAVGYQVKQTFDIAFDTDEVAQNFNNVWDINIPGITDQQDFSSFNVNVIYPSFLGNPAYIKPTSENINYKSGNELTFTKQDLGSSGISIAFGNFQIYSFNLAYHLQNKNYFPITTEIALPPSTNYQDVEIDNIDHKPTNVTLDKDGNWLAQYQLNPYQKLDIHVKGKAKLYLTPKSEALSTAQLTDYLKPQTYWEVSNSRIADLAKSLKTPYAIYQYVVKTLNYDYNRVSSNSPRLGALQALNNPNSAVCLEFTDLFIALSRAAGVPAREIEGYGYSSNSRERPLSLVEDVLHAWPEYYDFDKKTWIMVDPTWGNTTGGVDYFNTLDFDHFAFVVMGETSDYPVPAGGYKLLTDKNTKDVDVSITGSFPQPTNQLVANLNISTTLIAGIPTDAQVRLTNTGGNYIDKQPITLTTGFLSPQSQSFNINNLPPYGYVDIPISFASTPLLTNTSDTVKITAGNYAYSQNVRILPFFVNRLFIIGGITFVITCIILSLIAVLLRRISLLRQRREDYLRGESQKPQE